MSKGLYAEGGTLSEMYGEYENRRHEYSLAVMTSLKYGVMRHDSPVLDIGCRDPYNGLLRFLREFGWDEDQASQWLATPYVGVDCDMDPEVIARAEQDSCVTVLEVDLENFTMGDNGGVKQFAAAYCIEVLEHIENADAVIEALKDVAATIFVIGPNREFRGYYHDVEGHAFQLDGDLFDRWGFQDTGFANFNGRPSQRADTYSWDNSDPAKSSEAWGLWRDPRAEALHAAHRQEHTLVLDNDSTAADEMAFRRTMAAHGHSMTMVEKKQHA